MVPTEIYKEGGVAMNCKDCEHCRTSHVLGSNWSQKRCDMADNRFVCYSTKPIKTHPRWCPMKKCKKELDNIEEQEYEKQFEEEMMRLQPELFEDN